MLAHVCENGQLYSTVGQIAQGLDRACKMPDPRSQFAPNEPSVRCLCNSLQRNDYVLGQICAAKAFKSVADAQNPGQEGVLTVGGANLTWAQGVAEFEELCT